MARNFIFAKFFNIACCWGQNKLHTPQYTSVLVIQFACASARQQLVLNLLNFFLLSLVLGPIFPCTFDGRSYWSRITFGIWLEIISITIFLSPISDESSIKSPIKLMAEHWLIKSDNWRLNVAIAGRCLFAPETLLYFAGQNGNSCIKI